MQTDISAIPLVKNDKKKRFELTIHDSTAFINFGGLGNQITLVHTEVPAELAGKGVGKVLVEKTLNYIEKNNLKLLPFCPYVFAYIQKNPEWKRIVDPKFKAYDKL